MAGSNGGFVRPAVLALVLGLALSVAPAALRREVEPNDTAATAQPLLGIVSVGGAISHAGDIDLYSIRLTAGQRLTADILARGFRSGTSPGSSLSARLRILDTDGVSVLAEDTSMGSFDDPSVTATVFADGEYFVSVEDQTGAGSRAHVYVVALEIEGNDWFATATPLHPPELASIDALIWPAGDLDFYRFEGTAGQWVTVDLDSAVFDESVPPIKGVMTLYRPDQTMLATSAYSTANPNDPLIQIALPVTGTYFVEVRELRSFVGSESAFYQLGVELGPAASNNSIATASPVAMPRGVSGTVCASGDVDTFGFTAGAPGSLGADVDAREDLLSLLTGTVSAVTSAETPLGSSSLQPDPYLLASAPPGGLAVSLSGASSGLCQDAYYQLWLDEDADGDGIRIPTDLCPAIYDPGQDDLDHDGVGDACDDCVAVFNPGQESPLRAQEPVGDTVSFSGAGSSLTWAPAPGAIVSNVYRFQSSKPGTTPAFACAADNVAGAAWTDPAFPPLKSAFFYVVTGENCGESGGGADSHGVDRSVIPCPSPM